MELIDKASILSEFYAMRNDDAWVEFFDEYSDGIHLAILLASGDVLEMSSDGEQKVSDCYAALLDEWGVVDVEYSSLKDLIVGEPNEENA